MDRFEKLVRKLPTDCEAGFWRDDVLNLLRQEHRRVVRLVKQEYSKMEAITLDRTNSNGRIVMAHYKALQCRDILDRLNQRR